MTTNPLTWVPADACTLPTEERPLRVAEFDALFAQTLIAVRRLDAGLARLDLAGRGGLLEQVRDLVQRESSCCSFFGFTVTPAESSGGESGTIVVHLDIRVPTARAGVLTALVDRAEAARAGVTE